MNIIVPIKQVPDTGINLHIKDGKFDESSIKWVLSPYDEFALEESLKLKQQLGGKLFVITLGPQRSKDVLLTGLALGANEAFHLVVEQTIQDPLKIAQTLKHKLQEISDLSLVFCGKLSSDFNNFAVPQMLAQLLAWPFVSNVSKLDYQNQLFTLNRECGAGVEEVLQAPLPLVISADKGLNQPRYPSLPGIMKAKKKPFHVQNVKVQAGFQLNSLSPPPQKSEPQILNGEAKDQVAELVKILKEKEKVL